MRRRATSGVALAAGRPAGSLTPFRVIVTVCHGHGSGQPHTSRGTSRSGWVHVAVEMLPGCACFWSVFMFSPFHLVFTCHCRASRSPSLRHAGHVAVFGSSVHGCRMLAPHSGRSPGGTMRCRTGGAENAGMKAGAAGAGTIGAGFLRRGQRRLSHLHMGSLSTVTAGCPRSRPWKS